MNDLQHRPEFHRVPFLGLIFREVLMYSLGFPGGSVVKNLPANAGDVGSISESGRSRGEGNGNPLQCSFFILLYLAVSGLGCSMRNV